jgi:TRAP-type C4-dicarboxylate transport system permease small subunit
MSRQVNPIQRVIGWVARGGGILGELGLTFAMLSICYDVIMRYVFVAPTNWVLEVNVFVLVMLSTLPAADVLRGDCHIRVTFLTERMTPAQRKYMQMLWAAAGLFFSAIMTWKGSLMAWQAWISNDRMSTSLGTPMVIPYLFLPAGFGLFFLQSAIRLATALNATDGVDGQKICEEGPGQQI